MPANASKPSADKFKRGVSPKTKAAKKGGNRSSILAAGDGDSAKKEKKKIEELYKGPRPDQELLRLVHEEIVAGNPAPIEDVYTFLWKGGEDVNQRNYDGFTPLALAAVAGESETVAMLLERGADVTIPSVNTSETAFHYAVRYGHETVVQLLLPHAFKAGIVDAPNVTGFPPLQIAAEVGNLNILKMLLRVGADASARNMLRGGTTALHSAIIAGDADLAELLLDHDADVDVVDQLGRSPLHAATQRCNPSCVCLLLRSRADGGRRDLDGVAPLDLLPDDHEHRDRVLRTLQAYTRVPLELRHDAHFERKTGHPAELI